MPQGGNFNEYPLNMFRNINPSKRQIHWVLTCLLCTNESNRQFQWVSMRYVLEQKCLKVPIQTRAIRESDYSPAAALSEEKYIYVWNILNSSLSDNTTVGHGNMHPKTYQGILIHELWALSPNSWIHDTSTHCPCMYHFFKAPECGTFHRSRTTNISYWAKFILIFLKTYQGT